MTKKISKPKKSKPSTNSDMSLTKRILWWILRGVLVYVVITFLWVLTFRYFNPPFTYLMIQRRLVEGTRVNQKWVDIEKASPHLVIAAIASEDQKFFDHNGFDMESIKKAFEKNQKGKKIRGASTISQQVAKNVFLWPGRNWIRKGFEVYFTVLVELLWSKKRILEIYINVAETGKGMYGVGAASKYYFNKNVGDVSKENAALLIACFPNPIKYTPKNRTGYLMKKSAWIQKQMYNLGGKRFLKKHGIYDE